DPRLAAMITRLQAQEDRTRAIGAELRPELLGTGTVSGRAGGAQPSGAGEKADAAGLLPSIPNWDVGVVLSWPLFDGTVDARKKASAAGETGAREEIASAREVVVGTVERAFVNANVARAALPGLQRSVTAAIANEAQADARFKAGLGTSVELADAEALRAD